jgi:hypothetical protein
MGTRTNHITGEQVTEPDRVEVIITDVRIPFGSMVVLLIKVAVAAIPALLFLTLIVSILALFLGGYAALLSK